MRQTLMLYFFFVLLTTFSHNVNAQAPIFKNSAYALYSDSVVQGKFVATAMSATQINSNYQSPANLFISPRLTFKFSINRKDNEMKAGVNHQFNCIAANGNCEAPLIKFGTKYTDSSPIPANTYLAPDTRFTVKLDMREVIAAFKKDGYYSTFNGDKIYEADFKGLFVAGSTEPMVWDFDNLHQRLQLELKDPDGDGIYETSMLLNESKKEKDLAAEWKLTKDISAFPQYRSGQNMPDAIYNMALEEMQNAIEPDSTFRTGKEWAGVWTRDISYSIILSMAYLQPKVAKNSLLKKVKNGRIIQDTGTGGAYPNSTDRIIWAVAAWELYKATGDKDWLEEAFTIIKNSIDDDILNAHDKVTGMVRGESSFLDWREQTYPKWMQPADIFESECLGTNAVHYKANMVLAEMAALLNKREDEKKYTVIANRIKDGINSHLWMSDKGYYAQYIYGKNFKIVSPRSESLGEALAVIFGIAGNGRRDSVVKNTPVTSFGLPCIYPQIQYIPPYHNNAIWPFVQSYWAQAAAIAGNETSVLESISAVYRPAALFLTNKENFVVDDGDYKGTVINSSNMLWSLSGNISLVHKILFGIEFKPEGLAFHPFVPYALSGKRSLSNFSFRKAILSIELEGYGNEIASFHIDGKISKLHFFPATLSGEHTIKIVLANNKPGGITNEVRKEVTLATPSVEIQNKVLNWSAVTGVVQYEVLKNGSLLTKTNISSIPVPTGAYAEYQVIAVGDNGHKSFASEPVIIIGPQKTLQIEAEGILSKSKRPYKGFSGDGFIETTKQTNGFIKIPVTINEAGVYAIDIKYANGNGPTNTENKCAVRTLRTKGEFLGTLIFPQRGVEEWSNWGFSNAVLATFTKGNHTISLSLESANENMNGDINEAMIDFVRITRIK